MKKNEEPALDPVEITLILLGLAAAFLFLPALIFHGRAESGAWTWTAQCTIGCAVWWGFLLSCLGGFIARRVNSPAVRELERQLALREESPPQPPRVPQPLRPDLRLMWVTGFLEP